VHFVDFLCFVDEQIEASKERIYAIFAGIERTTF